MSDPGEVIFHPIGFVRTSFTQAAGTPIQAVYADAVNGTVEILPDYADGLRDLAGFERIWLICYFDRASSAHMLVTPYRDHQQRGVFATRAPSRPNSIGLSCVRLERVEGSILHVRGVDLLDGTPVLDIKPYIAIIDAHRTTRHGWFDESRDHRIADDRFAEAEHNEKTAQD